MNGLKALIGYEIVKSDKNYHIDLNLRWFSPELHWRRFQAETFRIAARIAECSETTNWCVDPHDDPGLLGHGVDGTWIRLELAAGTDGEMEQAENLLRQIAEQLMAESKVVD